jgi:O-antigen ligase
VTVPALATGRSPSGVDASALIRLGLLRGSVVALVVAVFFSNAVLFFFFNKMTVVAPSAWCYLTIAFASLALLSLASWRALLDSWLCRWCMVFVMLTSLWFAWTVPSEQATIDLKLRLLAPALLVALVALLATPAAVRTALRTITACLVIATLLNAYELFHPLTFSVVFGRAAGLYMNPNTCASSMVGGMILVMPVLTPRLRAAVMGMVGIAVLLTLSRGGIVLWGVASLMMIGSRAVRVRHLVLVAVALAVVGVAGLAATNRLATTLNIARIISSQQRVLDRVFRASETVEAGDRSSASRVEVAQVAWGVFEDNPFFGAGVGAVTETRIGIAPHNMYLRWAAEYGLVGLLVYPALIVALVAPAWRSHHNIALQFAVFLALLGLLSHNVLDDWPNVLLLAVMPALATLPAERGVRQTTHPVA